MKDRKETNQTSQIDLVHKQNFTFTSVNCARDNKGYRNRFTRIVISERGSISGVKALTARRLESTCIQNWRLASTTCTRPISATMVPLKNRSGAEQLKCKCH